MWRTGAGYLPNLLARQAFLAGPASLLYLRSNVNISKEIDRAAHHVLLQWRLANRNVGVDGGLSTSQRGKITVHLFGGWDYITKEHRERKKGEGGRKEGLVWLGGWYVLRFAALVRQRPKVAVYILGTQCLDTAPFCAGAQALVLGHQVWTWPKVDVYILSIQCLKTALFCAGAQALVLGHQVWTWPKVGVYIMCTRCLNTAPDCGGTQALLGTKCEHGLTWHSTCPQDLCSPRADRRKFPGRLPPRPSCTVRTYTGLCSTGRSECTPRSPSGSGHTETCGSISLEKRRNIKWTRTSGLSSMHNSDWWSYIGDVLQRKAHARDHIFILKVTSVTCNSFHLFVTD